MSNYTKDPFSFDGCNICMESKKATDRGRSLSYEELVRAFDKQSAQAKRPTKTDAQKYTARENTKNG